MNAPDLIHRLTSDPAIFGGKPIVRGRRLAVEHVLSMLAAGDSIEDILTAYSFLEPDDIRACLLYAYKLVAHERIDPISRGVSGMKVLLDTCVSAKAAEVVRQAGHDVIWAGDWPRDPGDVEILRRAAAESRILATIDKDFGELVIVQEMVHVGLIRLVGFRAADQGAAVVKLLSTYETELTAGAILTAEPWRVRVRSKAPE